MQVDFTDACKDQLTRQQKNRVKDHRMDYDLRNGCKNDVPKVGSLASAVPNGSMARQLLSPRSMQAVSHHVHREAT